VAAGAVLQSAFGFGFALTAAPALAATVGPRPAVSALAILGLVVSVMTLAGERRRPQVLVGSAAVLVAFAIPGVGLGVSPSMAWAPRR
jgi:uncharacterized membrane protein YfcA